MPHDLQQMSRVSNLTISMYDANVFVKNTETNISAKPISLYVSKYTWLRPTVNDVCYEF